MRYSSTLPRHMLAIALLAFAPAVGLAAPAQQPIVVAEAGDDDGDDNDVPRQRGVADEPEADAGIQPARTGGSFGMDAFDARDETSSVASANPGGVVCMAGCDGPSGKLVYTTPTSKKKSSE